MTERTLKRLPKIFTIWRNFSKSGHTAFLPGRGRDLTPVYFHRLSFLLLSSLPSVDNAIKHLFLCWFYICVTIEIRLVFNSDEYFLFKWAIPGLFFLYFCLFNTVDS